MWRLQLWVERPNFTLHFFRIKGYGNNLTICNCLLRHCVVKWAPVDPTDTDYLFKQEQQRYKTSFQLNHMMVLYYGHWCPIQVFSMQTPPEASTVKTSSYWVICLGVILNSLFHWSKNPLASGFCLQWKRIESTFTPGVSDSAAAVFIGSGCDRQWWKHDTRVNTQNCSSSSPLFWQSKRWRCTFCQCHIMRRIELLIVDL